jgi:hypothetical protein
MGISQLSRTLIPGRPRGEVGDGVGWRRARVVLMGGGSLGLGLFS